MFFPPRVEYDILDGKTYYSIVGLIIAVRNSFSGAQYATLASRKACERSFSDSASRWWRRYPGGKLEGSIGGSSSDGFIHEMLLSAAFRGKPFQRYSDPFSSGGFTRDVYMKPSQHPSPTSSSKGVHSTSQSLHMA